ncbi:MAG: bifunctional glutamate N-acetyltransferase/amino-acid acetyltransferase ArgJ [Chitinivibrionales bacterium]|nr:bifunctional glutamate N-acetyltransferase/amino-acid acetyltransferase ArgJ [Chitinivibrionales bacterium]
MLTDQKNGQTSICSDTASPYETAVGFLPNGSVTTVPGFRAAGVYCGIKRRKKDLALILSDCDCAAAGTFTQNRSKAACVTISQHIIAHSPSCRAILVNSGNANACTATQGMDDALSIRHYCSRKLGISDSQLLISSTGIIGKLLPVGKVLSGIDLCIEALSTDGGTAAAEAIRTTDTKAKFGACTVRLSQSTVTIGAICKGSGMIMPNMATMLAFLTTDACIDKNTLQTALSGAVNLSFNRITVDGETSTNDMVLMLANGKSGVSVTEHTPDYALFCSALQALCIRLAKSIAADGEGATKLITVNVKNAPNQQQADAVGRSIANSLLVKTALYGQDPNWGRIFSALGNSACQVDPQTVTVYLNSIPFVKPMFRVCLEEVQARRILTEPQVTITVDLHQGTSSSTWWTCDLTERYVHLNSSYCT